MRRIGMLLGLVGLGSVGLAGCPADDSQGDGTGGNTDTDTDTATVTMTTMSTTTPPTTGESDSDSATTDATSIGTTMEVTTTSPTDTDPSETASTTDTDGTTTGGQDCEACLQEACGELIESCMMDEDCGCWYECVEAGNSIPECGMMCMVGPPKELMGIEECLSDSCIEECTPDETTGGEDTGLYDQCSFMDPCPDDLDCAPGVNHCTQMCMGDDDCPDHPSGTGEGVCSGLGTCVLTCESDDDCPGEMTCDVIAFNVCMFGP